jgi:hypothetical protein
MFNRGRMTKRWLIVFVLFILLFMVSCKPLVPAGERPLETAQALRMVQTGTRGVTLEFLPNSPPEQLYDLSEFLVVLNVRNQGNYDISGTDCFIQITGIDPNIVQLPSVLSCGDIEGKNVYNVEGGFNQVQFGPTSVVLPAGVFEYNPPLQATVCYNYVTRASPQVCIDPLFYQISAEQKACRVRDVPMGGGQGAPVGINYVNVEMTGNKAVFEIDVVNYGGGRVLSRGANIQQCASGTMGLEDFDVIDYTVELHGQGIGAVDCKPSGGRLRLNNGHGKIVCTATLGNTPAYETPLSIELAYSYMDSISKQIKIIQTP